MCQKNDLPLSLKSDTFNALCSDFDQILRSTLNGMEETEQDVAEIAVKVKIMKCSPKVGQKLCGKAILNSVLDRT
ncbi:hypothetical protein [Flavonifractor plautii]|uniref:hypothetical protein n=1 Tax=Flavonifractor plautii TaxID=292800 RepID=UPI00189B377B|nr:hypothetical protein [Flavonifractor plautii]